MSSRLLPEDPTEDAIFGYDVDLNSEGTLALIGAPGIEAAYLFEHSENGWTQEHKFTDVNGESVAFAAGGSIAFVDPNMYIRQDGGWQQADRLKQGPVALNRDGSIAVVGSSTDNEDTVVFRKDNGGWSRSGTLQPSDPGNGSTFASDVGLTGDGKTAVLGVGDHGDEHRGVVYIFRREDDQWIQRARLKPEGHLQPRSHFGNSVAIDSDGTTLLIGTFEYFYQIGAAYAYSFADESWELRQSIGAPSPDRADLFGWDVALSDDGNMALIGEYGDDTYVKHGGSAHIYRLEGEFWNHERRLAPTQPSHSEQLGYSVAVSSEPVVICGAWGYEEDFEDAGAAHVFDPTVTQIGLTLRNVRPIQVVEETVLREGEEQGQLITASPPDLVAGRPTTVLFDLWGSTRLDELSDDETATVEVKREYSDGSNEADTITLSKQHLQNLAAPTTDEEEYFDHEERRELLPVFEPSESLESIAVEAKLPEDEEGQTRRSGSTSIVKLGSKQNRVVKKTRSLNIGLIEIADPDKGENYGNNEGRVDADFSELVSRATTRLKQTYPSPDIKVYSASGPLREGITTDSDQYGYEVDDLVAAHTALEEEFPDTSFDATAAIVPGDYPEFHDAECLFGYHPCDEQAAAMVQGTYPEALPDRNFETTVVHEIGHHFLPIYAYPRKLALRLPDINGGTYAQRLHARTESNPDELMSQVCDDDDGDDDGRRSVKDSKRLDSTGFDLTDGQYRLVGRELRAFMSYDFDDFPQWADAYSFQRMIDEELESHPFTAQECAEVGGARGPILRGVGRIDSDGRVGFSTLFEAYGHPLEASPDERVTVTVLDPFDNVLDQRSYSDRSLGTARTLNPSRWQVSERDVFVFAVAFPMDTSVVTLDREGPRTEFNPIKTILDDTVRRIPDPAFADSSKAERSQLKNDLETLGNAMNEKEYGTAADLLTTDIRYRLESCLRESYDVQPLEPSHQDVMDTVERMTSRLQTLADRMEGPPKGAPGPKNSTN